MHDSQHLNEDIWLPIEELARKVNSGELKAVDLVRKSLDRINEYDDEYKVVISLIEERALERATKIDKDVAEGKKVGKLAGVPFMAKDNFSVFGAETTAASNILKGYHAPFQATAINLLEAEGAICVAKANHDAFGHGASTENSDFFITKNPHDKTRVAGGSSGGSAAAIALNMVPFALGTDTGGSCRQPASYCGVLGYKPTYGLISRSGVVAMASSTDTIGTLANNAADIAYVVDVMAGRDDLDGTTIERNQKTFVVQKDSLKGKKVGVLKEHFGEGVDTEVSDSVKLAIKKIEEAGAEVVEVSMPTIDIALAVYYIIVPAEVSSNLARHDGQRYQYSAKDAKTLEDSYELTRSEGFGAEAKRRIMIGAHVLSSGYYDAYYKKAQIVRTKLINEFNKVFDQVDFIIGPVAPTTAFKIGENADPVSMYMQDIMTVAPSLAGIPSISVPCGKDNKHLPIGMQIMAAQKKDRELLNFANEVQGLIK